MKISRFRKEQIIGILKEHQPGLGPKALCRKLGVSDAAFYKWRSRYGGMEVSDAKKLKALEVEKTKLKKLRAEQVMDVSTLRGMLGSRPCPPLDPGQWSSTLEVRCATQSYELGHDRETLQSEAGLRFGRDRSGVYRRASKRPADADLRDRLKELSTERRRFGYLAQARRLAREPLPGRAMPPEGGRSCTESTAKKG